MRISDWSSDVCSSDLIEQLLDAHAADVWLLFGTLPFFACSADAAERETILRLRRAPNVTVRNDPDGRNRLNIDALTGGVRLQRSEESRVGKECVSTGKSRWSPYH